MKFLELFAQLCLALCRLLELSCLAQCCIAQSSLFRFQNCLFRSCLAKSRCAHGCMRCIDGRLVLSIPQCSLLSMCSLSQYSLL